MSIYFNREIYYPNLSDDKHCVTSGSSRSYNCIAYAVGVEDRRWEPSDDPTEAFWPADVSREDSLDSYISLFTSLGYEHCSDGHLDPGFEKVAIYTDSSGMFTHVAKQEPDGQWISKMGDLEDIKHSSPEVVEGRWNGVVNQFLRRNVADTSSE